MSSLIKRGCSELKDLVIIGNIVRKNTVARKESTMSDLMLDVDQAGELKAAFRRGDWTNAEIKNLCEGDKLAQVRNWLRGLFEIKPIDRLIDLDADPFVPDGWKVEEHQKAGKWQFDCKKFKLHWAKKQKRGTVEGNELWKEIKKLKPFNANLLDWLLKPENQKFIPEDWKDKAVFFWGTIYRDSGGRLCVRFLFWYGDGWGWHAFWLDDDWPAVYPTLVPASA